MRNLGVIFRQDCSSIKQAIASKKEVIKQVVGIN
jgi:hypothetical protein